MKQKCETCGKMDIWPLYRKICDECFEKLCVPQKKEDWDDRPDRSCDEEDSQ